MPVAAAPAVAGGAGAGAAAGGGAAAAGGGAAVAGGAAAAGGGGMSAATFALLASTGMSAFGSYQQGKYTEDMAEYEAQVYRAEAESIKETGKYETRQERIEKRRLLARQLVSFAGGGVVPGAGTPLKIMTKTGAEMERDISWTQYEYKLAESQTRSKARYAKYSGKSRKRAALWQSGSTVMTGAARVMDSRNGSRDRYYI